jgi:hypothetical protein
MSEKACHFHCLPLSPKYDQQILFKKSLPQNGKWTLANMDTGDLRHPLVQHFLYPNFKGFCGKANIKVNRKVGINIKNPFGGIFPLSVPFKYLFPCARRKLGSRRKLVDN